VADGAPARRVLEAAFADALTAVDAETAVQRAFESVAEHAPPRTPSKPGSTHVLALGKAAVPMARAAAACLEAAAGPGLIVTKDGHGGGFSRWPLLETAHPVPDVRSAAAGRRVLDFAASVPRDARLLVLLSGGTSALVSTPVEGLELEDLAQTNRSLLASGAPIEEVNVVRKRLAAVSGGRLAAACRAHRIDVWIVSDVLGDDPASIASGPCAPDPSSFQRAVSILQRRGVWDGLPERVRNHLSHGQRRSERDTPDPADPIFERVQTRIVASNADATAAAARSLRQAGGRVLQLGHPLEGEAKLKGRWLAALACSCSNVEPTALVAGGETTVTLPAEVGLGGRNQELALAAAHELARQAASGVAKADRVTLLAAGTDGSDGPTDVAGAVVDASSTLRMHRAGLDAGEALARHDATPALDAAGALLRTGPTGSNVMDLCLVWID
jgi:glycerate-2-kinase